MIFFIKIQNFSLRKIHLKIWSAKWQPFCPMGDESKSNLVSVLVSGVMWGHALAIFDDEVQRSRTGFIRWDMIDPKWKTYKDAVRNIIHRIFQSHGDSGTLKEFYDNVQQICKVKTLLFLTKFECMIENVN